jgi:hypothetical protein
MLALGAGQARMADFAAREAVMDSLSRVRPGMRAAWLKKRGFEDLHCSGAARVAGVLGTGGAPAQEVGRLRVYPA